MKLNRLSLNVVGLNRIGLNQIGSPSRGSSSGTDRPYIDPEVLASLKAVCICYGKSNDDPDRAVVKNLVDPDNPFVISNAAYDKMSSYGGYEFAKFDNTLDWYNTEGNDSVEVVSRNGHSITLKRLTGPNFWYFQNSTFRGLISNVIPFKVNSNKNITVIWDVHGLSISEGKDKSVRVQELVLNPNEDNYTNLKTLNEEELAQIDISTNSLYYLLWFDLSTLAVDEEVTIEMLPLFEGAFVTDGIDDLIKSTKTASEMGITNEVTVVSMIHQINANKNFTTTNSLRNESRVIGRNTVTNIGKTGIYGWYKESLKGTTATLISNILGDKNDYTGHYTESTNPITNSKFYVTGYAVENGFTELSSVAWYWTIIANKVLTTDQINQVIAYFNLDRTLKPDILCNTIKQGITNENHAEFGDKLIDFSGNGRDIQLNNLAWKGGSGIAAKPFETIKDYTIVSDKARQKLTIYNEFSYKVKSNTPNHYWIVQSIIKDNTSYQVTIITDKDCYWINSTSFTNNEGNKESIRKEYLVKANTPTQVTICGLNEFEYPEDIEPTTAVSYVNLNYAGEVTVTFIPSCKGGLLLDGVNDFGQFVGDLGLKDYTLIMNRAYNNLINNQVPLISSNIAEDQTPFIVEHWNTGSNAISFSYGASRITDIPLDINKKIVYQSTYSYMGYVIPKGNAISTGNGITLGKFGNGVQYSAICLWSLMLFPYSMSEFLIERQLKKHKLGTLYPDMVEFRPIVKSNLPYSSISYSVNPGEYISVDSMVTITVTLPNTSDKLMEVSCNAISDISISGDNGVYEITGKVVKSPQKINLVISSYLTMLSNSTLILNETLIKNE